MKRFTQLFIFVYIVLNAMPALLRYWQGNAFWYDFGILDSTIWQWAHFSLPTIPQLLLPHGKFIWADHFNPSAIFLAPVYWVTSRAEVMIILQTIFVGLSGYLFYLVSARLLKNRLAPFALTFCYLMYVGLQSALHTDIHNIVFSLLPFMAAIWALHTNHFKLYFLLIFITLGWQENLSTTIMLLGIYVYVSTTHKKVAFFTFLLGLSYGRLCLKVIIPSVNYGTYSYAPVLGPSFIKSLSELIYPYQKLRTIIYSFLSFGLIPLFDLSTLPMALEHFVQRFVLNDAATRWDLGFHYNATLSPILGLGALQVLRNFEKKGFSRLITFWGAFAILTSFMMHRFILHGTMLLGTHPVFYQDAYNAKYLRDFVKHVPSEGLLMVPNNLGAWLSHSTLMLPTLMYKEYRPDTIVLDLRDGQNGNNFFPLQPHQYFELSARLATDSAYSLNYRTGEQYIYTRIH